MKKSNSENYYYLGEVKEVKSAEMKVKENGGPLVEYLFELENEIEPHLYEYLILEENYERIPNDKIELNEKEKNRYNDEK